MKPLSEMTHYEVLELPPEASFADVERAYKIAHATFDDDSLATYSLYDEAEVAAIRERVEQAYRVLADNEARQEYDTGLGSGAPAARVELALDFEPDGEAAPAEVAPEIEEFADLEAPDEGVYDGARLRRTRLARGIEVDRIAQVTKINPTYLRCIEEEDFGALPAAVYVRGFVTAYARCVGLDPERVVPAYMDRFRAQVPEPRPGLRKLGLRR